MIEVKNIKKHYELGKNRLEILKGVDFSVQEGEFVMIMGPSGSGKSTLLHLIAGLDRATEGEIKVGGLDLNRLSDRQMSKFRNEKIGIVFQFYYLFPELSAYENVFLPALLRKDGNSKTTGKKYIQEKTDQLFEEIGMKDRRFHRPQELSGGEQQRIAIARALMNDPKILLADEPTGNLDTASGNVVLDFLEKIRKEKSLTMVMVTHNPEIIKRSDRAVYLRDGLLFNEKSQG
jgi:putative ABC transport system ATP-binding protein